MGGGAPGSTAGMKHDAFLDPDWGAPGIVGMKPFKATMPRKPIMRSLMAPHSCTLESCRAKVASGSNVLR